MIQLICIEAPKVRNNRSRCPNLPHSHALSPHPTSLAQSIPIHPPPNSSQPEKLRPGGRPKTEDAYPDKVVAIKGEKKPCGY